ncbi:hypothetical protein C2G38_2158568 [Gigaspora rosea]|uniref:Reverse transcriptase domain-containing protein n=1 Tax=Gigaspora rosea TaxID=44941 RepID=A0A397W3T0_9GLOM|nr:hypothetical protein C2G38_2158568 [Gigaspora rosea]
MISILREQKAKAGADRHLNTQLEELKVQIGEKMDSLLEKIPTEMNAEKDVFQYICNRDHEQRFNTEDNAKGKEEIVPVLAILFNKVLKEDRMPDFWHKSLITLIPKKSKDLELLNNWRPIIMHQETHIIKDGEFSELLKVGKKGILVRHQNLKLVVYADDLSIEMGPCQTGKR